MKKFFSFVAAILFAGSMMATDLLSIDFTQGQGEWTIQDVELGGLEFVWAQTEQYGMKATGYVEGNHATESWLISPAIDLSAAEKATLAFSHARRYGSNDQLSVLAKAGEGEWTALEVSAWPDGSNWTFVDATAGLAAFAGKANVQVAFKYTSTEQGGSTWEIKTVTVSDEATPEPPVEEEPDVVFLGSDFNGQGTAQTGSEVSATKEGVTFECDKAYCDSAYATLRCYKNGVIKITSATEQIGKLVFQFYQTYTGDLQTEVVINAKEWEYTLTSQARIEKLSIFFGEYEPVDPVEVEPISVAEALEIGATLEEGAKTTDKYLIEGYVTQIDENGMEEYGNMTFWIADSKESTAATNAEGAFQVYRGKPDVVLEVGDKIRVETVIQNFYGTIESVTGAKVVKVGEEGIENIELTKDVKKVMVDGVMYIVRDNKMFNVQGAQVR